MNDLSDVETRESVKFDRPPGQFMPAYDVYAKQDGRSTLAGDLLLKGGLSGDKGLGGDVHSPGYGPFFDDESGFIKSEGTLNAVQWYQFKDPDTGKWQNIPNANFKIAREITKKGMRWTQYCVQL